MIRGSVTCPFCPPLEYNERGNKSQSQHTTIVLGKVYRQGLSAMRICSALKHREVRDSGVLARVLRTEVKHCSLRELGFSSRERFDEKWLTDNCGTRIHAEMYMYY